MEGYIHHSRRGLWSDFLFLISLDHVQCAICVCAVIDILAGLKPPTLHRILLLFTTSYPSQHPPIQQQYGI